ncbi:hypothetical protein COO60DRAFT_377583 [Scenedesmus sp. NREL 46B-D3]|nr:hypothetical protein COO60DRAFT_377583 [Scenedesmus sp. NREL 46B-D3]
MFWAVIYAVFGLLLAAPDTSASIVHTRPAAAQLNAFGAKPSEQHAKQGQVADLSGMYTGTWTRLPYMAGSRHAAAGVSNTGGRFYGSPRHSHNELAGGGPALIMQGMSGRLLLQLQAGPISQGGQQLAGIEAGWCWAQACSTCSCPALHKATLQALKPSMRWWPRPRP